MFFQKFILLKLCSSFCQCILIRMPALFGAEFRVNYRNSDEPRNKRCFWHIIFLRDGRVKLFGKDNTQALLESNGTVPSKFLQVLSLPCTLIFFSFYFHTLCDVCFSCLPWEIHFHSFCFNHLQKFKFIGELTSFLFILFLSFSLLRTKAFF